MRAGRARGGNFARRPPRPNRGLNPHRVAGGRGTSARDLLSEYDRADYAVDQAGAIVEGLQRDSIVPDYYVPVGEWGLYTVPNEPVEPWDCERYANSPFCGGTGADPLDAATGDLFSIDPIIATNEDFSEVCVFLEQSIFGISLPSGGFCYRAPWARPRQPPTAPALPPGSSEFVPFDLPPGLDGGLECEWQIEATVEMDYVYEDNRHLEYEDENVSFQGSTGYVWIYLLRGVPLGYYYSEYIDSFGNRYPQVLLNVITKAVTYYQGRAYEEINTTRQDWTDFFADVFGSVKRPIPTGRYRVASCPPGQITPYTPTVSTTPPPRPSSDPPMCCCPETNDLLRLIALRMGVYSYPVQTPTSLIKSDGSSTPIQNQSMTELLAWTIRQMDGIAGQFPIEIEIEDIDPTTQGNQVQKVSLPNVAETLAELFGLAAKTSVNTDISINFLMRLAAEMIATKNAAIVTQDYAKANASFLGYRGNPKDRVIDYAFDPENLESLEKILQNSKKRVIGWQMDDPETVVEYLQKIVFSAGIIKSVFMRGKDDVESLIEQFNNLTNPDENADSNWRTFINALNNRESGFNRNQPTHPRVRDYTLPDEQQTESGIDPFAIIPATTEDD